jgi:hypothetical protein
VLGKKAAEGSRTAMKCAQPLRSREFALGIPFLIV